MATVRDVIGALAGVVDFRGDTAAEETVRTYLEQDGDAGDELAAGALLDLVSDRLNEHDAELAELHRKVHAPDGGLPPAAKTKGK